MTDKRSGIALNERSMLTSPQATRHPPKLIWIDLDNSPHVPFFAPIINELKTRGFSVTLTTRDAFQVNELAEFYHFRYRRIGRHYGKARIMKLLGTGFRALQLAVYSFRNKPDLSVSHGSRAQTLASMILGIPSVLILDYEFARPFPLMRPTWVMSPEVVPIGEGYGHSRCLHYAGIKEDVYVPTFQPDPTIKSRLGLSDTDVVVLLRPPASEAHYHSPRSDELFGATMDLLTEISGIRVVLLPRTGKQAFHIQRSWPEPFASEKIVIPPDVENGLNLIWHSDLVISGGGTMNREAAALGVPVYSIFRGRIGAVDRYLAEAGRLILVESPQEVRTRIDFSRRQHPWSSKREPSTALTDIVNNLVSILESRS